MSITVHSHERELARASFRNTRQSCGNFVFSHQVRIQFQDYDEQERHLRAIREAPFAALLHANHTASNNNSIVVNDDSSVQSNSGQDSKTVQTDLTYSVRNKKIQTAAFRIDESDSEDDMDIANQSLNTSTNNFALRYIFILTGFLVDRVDIFFDSFCNLIFLIIRLNFS